VIQAQTKYGLEDEINFILVCQRFMQTIFDILEFDNIDQIKQRFLSNTTFQNYDDIIERSC
jgi:hypothetical protein